MKVMKVFMAGLVCVVMEGLSVKSLTEWVKIN